MKDRSPGSPMKRFAGAFFILLAAGAWANSPRVLAAEDAPLADVLFPLHQIATWSRVPSERESRSLERQRSGWLSLLKLGGQELSAAITQTAGRQPISGRDYDRVLERLAKAPLRICTEKCHCPLETEHACIQVRQKGPISAEILFVHPCVTEGQGCGTSRTKKVSGADALSRALVDGAAQMVIGPGARSATKAAAEIASGALAVSTAVAFVLPRSCPGPFPEGALSFLQSAGFARPISSFADQCAARLVQPLFGVEWLALPKACRDSLDPSKWSSFARVSRSVGVRAVRCEGFCETLTCGDAEKPVARPMLFGARAVVSIPEEVCSGALPAREGARAFLGRTLADLQKAAPVGLPTAVLETGLRDCREVLLSKLGETAADSATHSSDEEESLDPPIDDSN